MKDVTTLGHSSATVYFSDEVELEPIVGDLIAQARTEILILHRFVYWHGLPGSLHGPVSRDCEVRVIGAVVDEWVASRLRAAGVALRRFATTPERPTLHHKLICLDRRQVLVGSMNLFARSLRRDREMLLVLESPKLAKLYAGEFERIWEDLGSEPSSHEVEGANDGNRLRALTALATRYSGAARIALGSALALSIALNLYLIAFLR